MQYGKRSVYATMIKILQELGYLVNLYSKALKKTNTQAMKIRMDTVLDKSSLESEYVILNKRYIDSLIITNNT